MDLGGVSQVLLGQRNSNMVTEKIKESKTLLLSKMAGGDRAYYESEQSQEILRRWTRGLGL